MENSFTSTSNSKHTIVQIEVFKTNIKNPKQANFLKSELLKIFCDLKVDFDLEDCDRILRVEGKFNDNSLFEIAKKLQINMEVLKD